MLLQYVYTAVNLIAVIIGQSDRRATIRHAVPPQHSEASTGFAFGIRYDSDNHFSSRQGSRFGVISPTPPAPTIVAPDFPNAANHFATGIFDVGITAQAPDKVFKLQRITEAAHPIVAPSIHVNHPCPKCAVVHPLTPLSPARAWSLRPLQTIGLAYRAAPI